MIYAIACIMQFLIAQGRCAHLEATEHAISVKHHQHLSIGKVDNYPLSDGLQAHR